SEDRRASVPDLHRSSFGEQRHCCAQGRRHWARRCNGEVSSNAAMHEDNNTGRDAAREGATVRTAS
ncbi:hypothetical protein U1Q18_009328, partial [Sarracenia purpurea var. burkii]